METQALSFHSKYQNESSTYFTLKPTPLGLHNQFLSSRREYNLYDGDNKGKRFEGIVLDSIKDKFIIKRDANKSVLILILWLINKF